MSELTKEQQDLIERFLTAQNAVEKHLQAALGVQRGEGGYTEMIREYERRHPRWPDGERLRDFAVLRNALVHDRSQPYRYLFVPLPFAVEEIERIRERLINPARVVPTFSRAVRTVQSTDTLATVLGLLHAHNFTKFPVYEESRFRGLLTENGIAHWLAHYVAGETLIDMQEVPVAKLLQTEEEPANHRFVVRDMPVREAFGLFGTKPQLEALLITQNGREEEKLLGIVTRWDVTHAPDAETFGGPV